MPAYHKFTKPVTIPVPGNKIIEEFIGRAHSGFGQVSVARMVAPPGWDEPAQTPKFDEITILLRGRMQAVINDDEKLILNAGETLLVGKNNKVQYSNPFAEEYECWSICIPAFSPEHANRES